MRNALSELPVLLCCLRGGMIAGFISSLLLLPGRFYRARRKGRRARAFPVTAFSLLDFTAAAALAAVFALTLLKANGGEPRLYAVCGFAAGAAITAGAVKRLALREPPTP